MAIRKLKKPRRLNNEKYRIGNPYYGKMYSMFLLDMIIVMHLIVAILIFLANGILFIPIFGIWIIGKLYAKMLLCRIKNS